MPYLAADSDHEELRSLPHYSGPQSAPSQKYYSGVRSPRQGRQGRGNWVESLKLWSIPCYARILRENNIDVKASPCDRPYVTRRSEEEVKRRIEEAIVEKKRCRFNAARVSFVKMAVEMPGSAQVWLDFARLETECGEYANALEVVTAALRGHANNEVLFQKKMHIEERMRLPDMIQRDVETLSRVRSLKALKVVVEGLLILARFGYEGQVREHFRAILEKRVNSSSHLFVDYLWFEEHCGSCDALMTKIPVLLERNVNFNPLWFACFALLEHYHRLVWDGRDVLARVEDRVYEQWMVRAIANLTNDIKWKVFVERISFWCRALLDIMSLPADHVPAAPSSHP